MKAAYRGSSAKASGLKPKDLMFMPARVAPGAASRWLVGPQSQLPWIKRNPMPESD